MEKYIHWCILKRGCIVTVAITSSVRQILPVFIIVSSCPLYRTVAEGCVGDGGGVFLSSAALSLQTMRAAVGGSAGLWCLMIGKLVACNGAAMCLIMQNRRVRVGREWNFRAPGRLMRGQLFVCIPRHLLPETRSQLPPLMKFDIVEMTGSMTALSQDRVKEEEEGGGGGGWGGCLISYHTCALRLHCSKVRAWWKRWWFLSRQAIHHSGGDSAEARSQRNNDTRRFE